MKQQIILENMYLRLEADLIEEIGKLLDFERAFSLQDDIERWKFVQRNLLSGLSQSQLRLFNEFSKLTQKQTDLWIRELYERALVETDRRFKPIVESGYSSYVPIGSQSAILGQLLEQATITNTLVVSNVISGVSEVYEDIINRSAYESTIGNKTLYQASMDTAREWACRGLPVLQTRDGRNLSIEGYTQMTMRATQKRVANAVTEQRFNDYDVDLIEFSSHLSSRPSHAPFQGKIYSRSGTSDKYPPLSSTTYGDPIEGMVTGINCRHQAYPFIEGLSTQRYKPYDAKKVEQAYKEEQLQRRYERNIRNRKKEKQILQAMNVPDEEIQKADRRIRNSQALMREFINRTDRTRRYNREQVVGG